MQFHYGQKTVTRAVKLGLAVDHCVIQIIFEEEERLIMLLAKKSSHSER